MGYTYGDNNVFLGPPPKKKGPDPRPLVQRSLGSAGALVGAGAHRRKRARVDLTVSGTVSCPTCAGAGGIPGESTFKPQHHKLYGLGGPSPNDVKQGNLGDCWLMSALMSVAKTHPEIIKRMIRREKDGTYTVTFQNPAHDVVDASGNVTHVPASVSRVNVTGAVPGDAKGNPIYAGYGSADAAAWPLVMEKAYAQEYGGGKGYAGLGGRSSVEAFGHITGWDVEAAGVKDRSFQDFVNAQNGGWPITAIRPLSGDVHAYSIQGFSTDSAGNKWVDLYNPWNGTSLGTGAFRMKYGDFQNTYTVFMGAKPPPKP